MAGQGGVKSGMLQNAFHGIAVVAIYVALLGAVLHEGWRVWDHLARSRQTNSQTNRAIPPTNTAAPISAKTSEWTFWEDWLPLLAVVVSTALSVVFRAFFCKYPGVILVTLGVMGENLWEAKSPGRVAMMYHLSAAMLVGGLLVEISEAVQMDGKVEETKKETELARKEAGEARERAAKSEIELEKIKERYRHRIITTAMRETFLKAISGAPRGRVKVGYEPSDKESAEFALSIWSLYKEAGYEVNGPAEDPGPVPQMSFGPIPNYSAVIRVKDPAKVPMYVEKAARALEAIVPSILLVPTPDLEDVLVIMVYPKPEPIEK